MHSACLFETVNSEHLQCAVLKRHKRGVTITLQKRLVTLLIFKQKDAACCQACLAEELRISSRSFWGIEKNSAATEEYTKSNDKSWKIAWGN